MIREVVGKEVKILLAVHAEHADEVGGVHAVSEELYPDARFHIRRLRVSSGSDRQAREARVRSTEHARVWVCSLADPLSLGERTNRMDRFMAAASPTATELVADGVEDGVLRD